MILKRQEKNGKIKAMYSSETVCASVFDTTTRDLIVIFNNGGEDKASLDAATKAMMETMALTLASFVSTGKVDYDAFRKLESKMQAYDKVANPQPEQAEA